MPPTFNFDDPISQYARTDVTTLNQDMTVQEAFAVIRRKGVGEKIIYFYVVNAENQLAGVLPTRRLLTAEPEAKIADLMVTRVVSIPANATMLDACEQFVLYRYLAYPVLDAQRHVVGVVDVGLFTEQVFNLNEVQRVDDLFETLGFRISQLRRGDILGAWRLRFPWVLATVASGTLCALLVSCYEVTLGKSLVLAFFLTLVLGLGESVAVQSMTVTIHALRHQAPTWSWYWYELRRELATAVLLGLGSALTVIAVVLAWKGVWLPALSMGLSILSALVAACFFGLSIPALFHTLRLDPKIASGPITLAVTDLTTVFLYFATARLLLG